MAYNAMGDYTGFDESVSEPVNPYEFEDEEKRKEELKRQLQQAQREEEELASKVSHKQEVTISLKGINPGIYFLKLGKETKKFLVVK